MSTLGEIETFFDVYGGFSPQEAIDARQRKLDALEKHCQTLPYGSNAYQEGLAAIETAYERLITQFTHWGDRTDFNLAAQTEDGREILETLKDQYRRHAEVEAKIDTLRMPASFDFLPLYATLASATLAVSTGMPSLIGVAFVVMSTIVTGLISHAMITRHYKERDRLYEDGRVLLQSKRGLVEDFHNHAEEVQRQVAEDAAPLRRWLSEAPVEAPSDIEVLPEGAVIDARLRIFDPIRKGLRPN